MEEREERRGGDSTWLSHPFNLFNFFFVFPVRAYYFHLIFLIKNIIVYDYDIGVDPKGCSKDLTRVMRLLISSKLNITKM